ncbi:MAG: AraC family transcriptional regulator [Verrucomicrobiia bacterium]
MAVRPEGPAVNGPGRQAGYTNPSHFARLFRRETGLSPSDYRRQR